jgi:hypothetical protein
MARSTKSDPESFCYGYSRRELESKHESVISTDCLCEVQPGKWVERFQMAFFCTAQTTDPNVAGKGKCLRIHTDEPYPGAGASTTVLTYHLSGSGEKGPAFI